jgi:hypothetical protein
MEGEWNERVGMKKWDEQGVWKKEVTEGGKEWKADGKREEMEEESKRNGTEVGIDRVKWKGK